MDYSLDCFERYFSDLAVSFDHNLLSQCENLCKKHNMDVENFSESWLGYALSIGKRNLELNISNLDAFDRFICNQQSKKSTISSPFTPQSSKKRLRSTPERDSASKRRPFSNHDNALARTPVGKPSLDATTPSGKYSCRQNKGQVVSSNLDGRKRDWRRIHGNGEVRICSVGPCIDGDKFKYMFTTSEDKVSVLNKRITSLMEKFVECNNVADLAETESAFQESRVVVGRVCVDAEKQIFLEGSNGLLLPMSFEFVNEVFLFPGQVVAVECTNSTGKFLNVQRILEGVLPPMPEYRRSRDLSIVVASGPFSTGDVVFDPLDDLMEHLKRETPDICILFGPFIDCSLAEEKLEVDFEELQRGIFSGLSELTERLNFKMIIVPSQRDFLHEFVYPQPAFSTFSSNIECMSDPCTVDIDGLVVGLTSTDILFHMNKEVVSKSSMPTNRVSKLARCLLTQCSYYPLYPPSSDVNLDLEAFGKFGGLDVLPHLLVAPSELNCFIKDVEGTTFINPGRLAKAQAGGTFCRIFVQAGDGTPPVIEAEVVRI